MDITVANRTTLTPLVKSSGNLEYRSLGIQTRHVAAVDCRAVKVPISSLDHPLRLATGGLQLNAPLVMEPPPSVIAKNELFPSES